jgi:hypothetical protein
MWSRAAIYAPSFVFLVSCALIWGSRVREVSEDHSRGDDASWDAAYGFAPSASGDEVLQHRDICE